MKKKNIFLITIVILLYSVNSFSKSDSSDFRFEDKVRIKEAVKIFSEYGNLIWDNWDTAPFAILLVTNDNEYLMFHSNPTEEFNIIGYDSTIESEIYRRPRQFSNNMLATFPAINGIPTVVVGLPENTSRPSMDWIITILHEHFHQFQSSRPDYYASIDLLDLSEGDNSGMWMLNYKFPYDNKTVSEQYDVLTQSAKKTVLSINESDFESNLNIYINEREKFKSLLNKKDYDYFSFQIWQEGLARYTEIKIADFIKDNYTPSDGVTKLDDYVSPDSFYVRIKDKLLKKADKQNLSDNERDCFYTLGAMEGMILDKSNPDWKDLYFKEKFYIEKYMK